jgi:hypothetical protein
MQHNKSIGQPDSRSGRVQSAPTAHVSLEIIATTRLSKMLAYASSEHEQEMLREAEMIQVRFVSYWTYPPLWT